MTLDPDILADYVEETGLDYSTSGGSWVFTCPHCGKRKLYLRKRDGRYTCFYCHDTNGTHGRAEYALADLQNIPVADVREKLYGYRPSRRDTKRRWGQPANDTIGDPDVLDFGPVAPTLQWPSVFVPIDDPRAQGARDYLAGRGVDLATAISHGLRANILPQQGAIVFPVEDHGQLRGWQERHYITQAHGRKVSTSRGLAKSDYVMFDRNLAGSPHAIVCEGPVDALKASICGGAVATLGKIVSPRQREVVRSYGATRVYLALDTDAIPEMRTLAREFMREGVEVWWMRVPAGRKDFGECSFDEVREAFDSAVKVTPLLVWRAVRSSRLTETLHPSFLLLF